MITLNYRANTMPYFFKFDGTMFGDFMSETSNFEGELTAMTESRGIYGENNVEHDKLEGDISYHPELGLFPLYPSSIYPMRRRGTVVRYNNLTTTETAEYGCGIPGTSAYGACSTGTPADATVHKAFTTDLFGRRVMYRVHKRSNSMTSIQLAYRFTITDVVEKSGDGCTVYYIQDTFNVPISGLVTAFNWLKFQPPAAIIGSVSCLPILSSSSKSTSCLRYRLDCSDSMSPGECKRQIDTIAQSLFSSGKFPIEEVPYGDLAMAASEKTVSNKVNMLEFLRDLRHPADMIPSLKNLKSLKGWSNNYLAVRYGILPTIDDISSIIRAFKQIAPYIDKNGLTVYTARQVQSKEEDGLSFSLDQRIKLAIGNEDSEFEALIERLESWGVLPTFETLWDLTKYSFVIDWFVDVGGFLERVDTRLRLIRLNIAYVTMSRRKVVSGYCPGTSEFPFVGQINWVHYHRWVSDQCPVPPLSLKSQIGGFNHWLEASSLLVQRS